MKVKPETPEVIEASPSRPLAAVANGLPLPSSGKACGCGAPLIGSRDHLVSWPVTVARSTCP